MDISLFLYKSRCLYLYSIHYWAGMHKKISALDIKSSKEKNMIVQT